MSYCRMKTEDYESKIQIEFIETEIDEDLRLKD